MHKPLIFRSYQCKLAAVDSNKDDNDSSDSDENRRNWNDDDEREYRRQEELYARRIFDVSDTGSTQKLQSGVSTCNLGVRFETL